MVLSFQDKRTYADYKSSEDFAVPDIGKHTVLDILLALKIVSMFYDDAQFNGNGYWN